jgi:hypothetical protein
VGHPGTTIKSIRPINGAWLFPARVLSWGRSSSAPRLQATVALNTQSTSKRDHPEPATILRPPILRTLQAHRSRRWPLKVAGARARPSSEGPDSLTIVEDPGASQPAASSLNQSAQAILSTIDISSLDRWSARFPHRHQISHWMGQGRANILGSMRVVAPSAAGKGIPCPHCC